MQNNNKNSTSLLLTFGLGDRLAELVQSSTGAVPCSWLRGSKRLVPSQHACTSSGAERRRQRYTYFLTCSIELKAIQCYLGSQLCWSTALYLCALNAHISLTAVCLMLTMGQASASGELIRSSTCDELTWSNTAKTPCVVNKRHLNTIFMRSTGKAGLVSLHGLWW